MSEVQLNNVFKKNVTGLGLPSGVEKTVLDYIKLRGAPGAWALANDAWQVVRVPGAGEVPLGDALRRAEEAFASDKSQGFFSTVLAAAHYRRGDFEKAIDTLKDLLRLSSLQTPPDLAILAMASHRLGRTDDAREYLGQLRRMTTNAAYQSNQEIRELQKEAEAVIQATGER